MRVVVVGGTGNISTSIVRLLLEHGHDVTCVNRGTTAAAPEGVRTIIVDRHDTERRAYEALTEIVKQVGLSASALVPLPDRMLKFPIAA